MKRKKSWEREIDALVNDGNEPEITAPSQEFQINKSRIKSGRIKSGSKLAGTTGVWRKLLRWKIWLLHLRLKHWQEATSYLRRFGEPQPELKRCDKIEVICWSKADSNMRENRVSMRNLRPSLLNLVNLYKPSHDVLRSMKRKLPFQAPILSDLDVVFFASKDMETLS